MLEIYDLNDAFHIIKESKTEVYYYLFEEYEIHLNKILPHTIQKWHYHSKIEEVILVIKGKIKCLWFENEHMHCQTIYEKQLVLVKQSIHTLKNDSDEDCEFIVFRLVLDGKNKRNIMENDKIIIEHDNEIFNSALFDADKAGKINSSKID